MDSDNNQNNSAMIGLANNLQSIQTIETIDRDSFCWAISRTLLVFDRKKLARQLRVSSETIRRWGAGESACHELGRKPVIENILEMIKDGKLENDS